MAYDAQQDKPSAASSTVDTPEVFAVQRNRAGWQFNRRRFLVAAAATTAGCIKPEATTPTLPPTSTPSMSPAMAAAACQDVKAHNSSVNALAMSPDGKLLVSGSSDHTIKLWSLPEGNLLKTLEGHTYGVNAVAISPDGKLLASGSSDSTIKLWSLPEHVLLKTLEGHTAGLYALAISPDSKLLALGGGYVIELWSLPEGHLLKTLEAHQSSSVEALAISPDGRMASCWLQEVGITLSNSGRCRRVTCLTTWRGIQVVSML